MFQRLEDAKLGEDEEFRSEEHMRAEEALVGLKFLQAGSVKVVACMIIRHARVKATTHESKHAYGCMLSPFEIKSCQIQVEQLIGNRIHPLIPTSDNAHEGIPRKFAAWAKYYFVTHVAHYDMSMT